MCYLVCRLFTIIIILGVHHHLLIFWVHYPALRVACYLYPDERVVNLHFMSTKELAIYCLLRGEHLPTPLCQKLNIYQSSFCSQNIPRLFFLMFWLCGFFCYLYLIYLLYSISKQQKQNLLYWKAFWSVSHCLHSRPVLFPNNTYLATHKQMDDSVLNIQ